MTKPCQCLEYDPKCMRPGVPMEHIGIRGYELCSGRCPPERPCPEGAGDKIRAIWDAGPQPIKPRKSDLPCAHLGEANGQKVECPTCQGKVQIKLVACSVFGQCSTTKKLDGIACCAGCPEYSALAQAD